MKTIGLIAGGGLLPREVVRAAHNRGLQVAVVAVSEQVDDQLKDEADAYFVNNPGQFNRLIEIFKTEGVKEVVMVGKVDKRLMFTDFNPDLRMRKLLSKTVEKGDQHLLSVLTGALIEEGFEVASQADYLEDLLAPAGRLCGPEPEPPKIKDLELGTRLAPQIAELDVGQTVVLKDGVVLAVEAVEGTDRAILRAGKLGGSGAVVVKASRPGHAPLFEMPAVGPETLRAMSEVSASLLAVEAGRVLVIGGDSFLGRAEDRGISVLGFKTDEARGGN